MNAYETLQKLLENDRDDSLEPCERAFRRMTDEQLDKQHGQSGYTRRLWLENYRREWEAARQLVDAIPDLIAACKRMQQELMDAEQPSAEALDMLDAAIVKTEKGGDA